MSANTQTYAIQKAKCWGGFFVLELAISLSTNYFVFVRYKFQFKLKLYFSFLYCLDSDQHSPFGRRGPSSSHHWRHGRGGRREGGGCSAPSNGFESTLFITNTFEKLVVCSKCHFREKIRLNGGAAGSYDRRQYSLLYRSRRSRHFDLRFIRTSLLRQRSSEGNIRVSSGAKTEKIKMCKTEWLHQNNHWNKSQ